MSSGSREKTVYWDKEGTFTNELFRYINLYDFLLGEYEWIQQESTFWTRNLWDSAGGLYKCELSVDG